ncbi:hypothetical protein TYRP_016375 [Tyrophagus putrescentiae]|nr:hypothetical protein TYRP_016375 [Tyrophagus putrescentiae]
MGQCCSGSPEEGAKEGQPKGAQVESIQPKEKSKVAVTVSPKKKTSTPKRGNKEEKEEVVGRRPSSLKVKNIHYIESKTKGYMVRKQIPQPVKSSPMTAAATINSRSASERIAHRKMAPGPAPKVAVDMNKIIENLREKQTMRNQVALIGAGGQKPSKGTPLTTQKSTFKSARSGHQNQKNLRRLKSSGARGDLRSSSSSSNRNSLSPSGLKKHQSSTQISKSRLGTRSNCGSSRRGSSIGRSNSSSINSSTCSFSRSYTSNLTPKEDNLSKKKHAQSKVTNRNVSKSNSVEKKS